MVETISYTLSAEQLPIYLFIYRYGTPSTKSKSSIKIYGAYCMCFRIEFQLLLFNDHNFSFTIFGFVAFQKPKIVE